VAGIGRAHYCPDRAVGPDLDQHVLKHLDLAALGCVKERPGNDFLANVAQAK
jgi:hypothetical protein